jgi:hypothetical protein
VNLDPLSITCPKPTLTQPWRRPAAQVLGNAKGVVAATISVLLFHNPVTAMSVTGYGITVCGVVAYSQARAPPAAPARHVRLLP